MKNNNLQTSQVKHPVSKILFISLFLLIVTFAVYSPVRNYEFINFDDNIYVTENKHVKNGLSAESIQWAFKVIKTDEIAYWHPIAELAHMLDCQFFGVNPGMHHLSNLFYHLLNSLLLFLVFIRMTGAIWKSAFVAAVFALHPINVDSVAWIAERKNLVSTSLWFLTMLGYVYYALRPTVLRYFLVLTTFSLGLMAKPMLVTLPCVLLLLDYWPMNRIKGDRGNWSHNKSIPANSDAKFHKTSVYRLIFEKIPMLCLSFVAIWLSFYSLQSNGQIINETTQPIALRISNSLISYIHYIWHLIFPINFAIFYPFPTVISLWKSMGAALALIMITGLVITHAKKKSYMVTGWLWFLGTLVPVIGLIQGGLWPAMADRWAYVPFIGLFIILTWGIPDLFLRFRKKKIILAGLAITTILTLIILTSAHLKHWQNSYTLFQHALKVTQNNHIAHIQVGLYLSENNNYQKAIPHFKKAIEIMPTDSGAHEQIAIAYSNMKDYPKALYHYEKALLFAPSSAGLFNKIGNVYTKMQQHDNALKYYLEAITIDPNDPKFYNNLGAARYLTGKFDLAIIEIKKAIKRKPDYAEAYYNLGLVHLKTGDNVEATRNFLKTVQYEPNYKEAHNNLAKLYYNNGNMEKAIVHYAEAVRISPEDEIAQFNIGIVLYYLNHQEKAIKHFQEALRLNPDYANAKNALAQITKLSEN